MPVKEEMLLEITLNWTIPNLNSIFNNTKTTPDIIRGNVFPDYTNGITLMSHSSSGHQHVSYMNKTCGIVTSNFTRKIFFSIRSFS